MSLQQLAAAETSGPVDPRVEKERDRRRRREGERSRDLRRMHDEEAAHSLFQRLAKDVRDVFHELNMSVVAAEKERLLKDERYRKEREFRDRALEQASVDRELKERKEREEREQKFWATLDERAGSVTALRSDSTVRTTNGMSV